MAREQELLAAFIDFADTITDEYDVVEVLQRLAERCVEVTGASEAGVMLADQYAALRYVASSSERMRLVELYELQHDEGPCLDAFRTGTAVHSVLSGDAHRRWPLFASRAQEAGFQSVSALPMRLRNEVIGALNVLSSHAALLSAGDQQVAQALADIATIGILQERALSDARIVTSQLGTALESRIVIEQAKGFVSERDQISLDGAGVLLRAYARSHNVRLSQVAQGVVDGTLATAHLSTKTTGRAGPASGSERAPSQLGGSIRVRTARARDDLRHHDPILSTPTITAATELSGGELSRTECLALLDGANFGQLVLTRHALPAVVPACFLVRDDEVIVHLSAGLHPVPWRDGEVVVLHVGHFDDDHLEGWSISLTGAAHSTLELALDQEVPRAPWIPRGCGDLVAIPTDIIWGERLSPVETTRDSDADA